MNLYSSGSAAACRQWLPAWRAALHQACAAKALILLLVVMAGVATSTAHDAALWEGPEFTEGPPTPCRRWQRLKKTLGEQYLNASSVFIRWQHFISTGHKWRFRQKHIMFALKCKVYNQTHLEVPMGLSFPECAVRKAVPRKRSYLTWTWKKQGHKGKQLQNTQNLQSSTAPGLPSRGISFLNISTRTIWAPCNLFQPFFFPCYLIAIGDFSFPLINLAFTPICPKCLFSQFEMWMQDTAK